MKIEDYITALEEEIGTIKSTAEYAPGVYYLEADRGDRFLHEYYAMLDGAPFAAQVQNYGQEIDGLRLYAEDEPGSGWDIVEYEISKYNIAAGKAAFPEETFHDMSIHAMESYPEYFGTLPVPYHTPYGYTLRCRTLANGIYWLETSRAKELLSLSFPIWNAELSTAALALAKVMELDRITGIKKAMGSIFFPKESSCVPIYELMMTRQEWDGTVIHRPALMNALWEYAPKYAMHLNGGSGQAMDDSILQSLENAHLEIIPPPDGKHIIGMFPGEGTDFLLLK